MYLFSIVMPIYNVDKWLEEAFTSLVNQKGIDFENEVEVLLVNDCSPDNSKAICLRYANEYKNVKYIENPNNKGLSATRNVGLQVATGAYVNFFDPDDILSSNVLAEIKAFIECNNERIAHISIPLIFFEAEQGLHSKYKLIGDKNRIVDLEKEPSNFILSSASSFYRREDILNNGLQYDESLFGEEDTKLNFELYREICPKYAYVCENGVAYYYRRRKDANSQVDKSKVRKEAFYTPANLVEGVKHFKGIPDEAFYELCIYELRSRLKNIKCSIFETDEEFFSVLNRYRAIIRQIPESFIANKTKFLDINQKLLFLTQIYSEPLHLAEDGLLHTKCGTHGVLRINDLPLDIKAICLEKNELRLDIVLNLYGVQHVRPVIMEDNSKKIIFPSKTFETDSIYIKSIDSIKSSSSVQYSRLAIPLDKIGKYRLYYYNDLTGYLHIVNRIQTYSENPFLPASVFNSSSFKKYTNFGTSVTLYNRLFRVEKANLFRKLADRFNTVISIYKMHNKFKWLRFCKVGEPRYWLFNDRPINANDNAESLFTFVNAHYPDIAKNSFYVLSKNSPEIDRISKIGNVVIQNSLKHKILYLNAKYILTSHLATSFFKPISFRFLKYYNDLVDSKIVWLQHGITMNDIEYGANKFHKQINKIVVAAKLEEQIFSRDKYFFDSTDILKTGFPRYDNLHNRPSKKILIMPTWRSYLSGKILSNGMHAAIPGFEESEFYKCYSNLLSNKRFLNILKNKGYSVTFVLHPGLRQYSQYFKKYESASVKIVSNPTVSYKDLFNTSSLMITDYSSVFFDFVYQKKPCIFYQFDKKDFFEKHYKEGEFKFETMAPGPICVSDVDVIDWIIKHMNNEMKMFPEYLRRSNNIYINRDTLNSHRIIKELMTND